MCSLELCRHYSLHLEHTTLSIPLGKSLSIAPFESHHILIKIIALIRNILLQSFKHPFLMIYKKLRTEHVSFILATSTPNKFVLAKYIKKLMDKRRHHFQLKGKSFKMKENFTFQITQ